MSTKNVPTKRQLLEMLNQKEKESEEYLDISRRLKADLENFKKRTQREKEDMAKFANESIIKELIEVLDNFNRALKLPTQENDSVSGVIAGVELIKKQFEEILIRKGLTQIESVGKEFNPYLHEAIGEIPSDEYPPHIVIEELQHGYLLYDKVIRPSKVMVSIPLLLTSDS